MDMANKHFINILLYVLLQAVSWIHAMKKSLEVAVEGDRIEIECTTNSSFGVDWKFSNATKEYILYIEGIVPDKFKMEYSVTNGNYSSFKTSYLSIARVKKSNVGTYICLKGENHQEILTSVDLALLIAAGKNPINQAVVDGQDVTFRCSSEDKHSSQWKHRDVGLGGEEITIANGQNVTTHKNRMAIISNERGDYDLLISGAGRPEAGTYTCIKLSNVNNYSENRRYEAQLVIIHSQPKCRVITKNNSSVIRENDIVQMYCALSYFGELAPTMTWWREDKSILVDEVNTTIKNNAVRSMLTVQLKSHDNGVRFVSYTYFQEMKDLNSSDRFVIKATNAPDYNFTWISPALDVLYGPQNLTVLVSSDRPTGLITFGDHFECYADGNPAPEFEWTIKTSKANTSVYSHAFYVNLNMLQNQYIIIECKAKNSISEVTTELTFNTTVSDTIGEIKTQGKNFHLATNTMSLLAPVIVVGLIVFIHFAKRNCTSTNRMQEQAMHTSNDHLIEVAASDESGELEMVPSSYSRPNANQRLPEQLYETLAYQCQSGIYASLQKSTTPL